MTRLLRHLLLIAACIGLTGAAFGQAGRPSVLPTPWELERFGLERGWRNQATLNVAIDRIAYLTADEDNVYAQSRSGIVTAFDAETGKRLWSRLLGPTDAPSFPAVTNTDHLLIATGMNMFAVDKFNGKLLWRLNLPHHPTTAPGISDHQAYIGTLDGSAYAFDLKTIRQLFQDQLLPDWSDVSIVWRFRSGAPVTSPPVAAGRLVNFASEDGSLYSVDMNDGKLRFQFETNGAIQTPIARNQDSLLIASDDVRLFSINSLNGKLRWSFVAGTPILEQPQIVGSQVFVAPQMGGLYALNMFGGEVQWHQTRATEFLAAASEFLFASDELGNLLILSRNDGAVIGSIPLREMSVRVRNDRTDRVFLASPLGLVLCLRERGSEFPTYHKFPERQPMLPEFGDDEAPAATEPAASGAAP
ncbi:MAG: PQQ-binding-like beta-propeller repeat protein [Planctomycetaceae bacterium]